VGNWGEAGEVISPAVKGGAIQSLFPALPHLAEGDSAVQAVGGAPTPASLCCTPQGTPGVLNDALLTHRFERMKVMCGPFAARIWPTGPILW
jgi:hypothetical protein